MPTVSIIVPVYNTVRYLPACVESLLGQTLDDIEIILVDDGSEDGSAALCDAFAARDPRVRAVHRQNAGAAAARNCGLRLAGGRYIAFADSDDWADADMAERMVAAAESTGAELVICDCLKEGAESSRLYTHALRGGYFDREQMRAEYFDRLLMPSTMEYPVTISNGLLLIRRTVIDENGLAYPEGMRYSEDLLFGSAVGYHARSMVYLKGYAPYHYRQVAGSVTHTDDRDRWPLLRELFCRIEAYFAPLEGGAFAPQIDRCMLFFVYMAMGQRMSGDRTWRQRLRLAGEVLDDPLVHGVLRRIRVSRLDVPLKLRLLSAICQKRVLRPAVLLLGR